MNNIICNLSVQYVEVWLLLWLYSNEIILCWVTPYQLESLFNSWRNCYIHRMLSPSFSHQRMIVAKHATATVVQLELSSPQNRRTVRPRGRRSARLDDETGADVSCLVILHVRLFARLPLHNFRRIIARLCDWFNYRFRSSPPPSIHTALIG